MRQRYKGYVVGSDASPDRSTTTWKVRVKDPACPQNGQKLVVASTHDGITLARGLNVTFVVGTVDDPGGHKMLRAVDVQLD